MKLKKGFINIIVGITSQIIIIALGLIVPRLILVNYGSEVNGIFNSISQIYSYIALLEAGAGAATLQALYKCIDRDDKIEVSSIISATHKFYKKISLIYTICVIIFGIIFAFATTSEVGKIYVLLIFWLQGVAGIVNFRFVAAEKSILTVDGKNYITNGVTAITTIITSIGKIILVNLQINIVLLQVFYSLITVLQMLFYIIYFKKKYPWINLKAKPNDESLKSKNNFLITKISWTVFSCTDTILLSFFCDFKIVSVYAIYNLIFSSLAALLNAVHGGTEFIVSRSYHKNKTRYIFLHDVYENIFDTLIFSTMSICCVVILPFMKLYTDGVNDIQYVDKYLPLLFSLVQIISWSRYTCENLVNISGHIKYITKISIIETVLNIILSIFLVNYFNIYGVLIATIVSLLLKSIYIIIYSNKKILDRLPINAIKTILINTILFIIIYYFGQKLDINTNNYMEWLILAICVSLVVYFTFAVMNILFNIKLYKALFKEFRDIIRKRFKKRQKVGGN